MTAILTITNQKGGVGKTTTAINLAAALALRDKRTLLIDLDPQSNSTIAFFDAAEIQSTMYDVFGESRAELSKVILPTKNKNLSVAPARLALAKLEQQLAGQFDAPFKLKDALGPVLKDYDYVVIDTPPALGILTVNAMVASTHLLVPIQAAYFAIEGTDDLLETYERIRARPNPALESFGRAHNAIRQAHQHRAGYRRTDSHRVRLRLVQNAHLKKCASRRESSLQRNNLYLRAQIAGRA